MDSGSLLQRELKGSVEFFQDFTNLDPHSRGFGLTVDSTQNLRLASIAATGFALSAWVIACERGFLPKERALEITRGTLHTLLHHVPHHRGFFAHFLHMDNAQRWRKCEYSTIDTALCLNGVITAAAYFEDNEVRRMADELLKRVDWNFIVFEQDAKTLFRMAYNPDRAGSYVTGEPGFISQWDMAAEQKMMYLQAAGHIEPSLARDLYHGFRRDKGVFDGQEIIISPGGSLFIYQFSEAWLDTARYLDPDGVDWFNNTRLATLANRAFCMAHSDEFKTYGANSWGSSAGDAPWGYDVSGAPPSLHEPKPNGTVSIYGAISSLPFVPELAMEMIDYLYREHPQTWGKYGFFDAYNLAVDPPWYSSSLYGIDKGCSMIMVENYLSGLIWDVYTNSPYIQNALDILNFSKRD
jgi:hypothetical protein